MALLPMVLFVLPFVGALVCAVAGTWWPRCSRPLALGVMLPTAALGVWANFAVADGPLHSFMGGWAPPIGIELMLDHLSAMVAAVVGVVGLIVLIGSGGGVRQELTQREPFFYSVSLLLVGGLMGMVVTHDLFNLFVHVEVTSLSAYGLTAAGRKGAPRAALRYLLIGSLGASFYLLGVGFVYAATGSLNMSDVAARLPDAEGRLVTVSVVLMVVGLSVKMGLFPLHAWMPDAYSRAAMGGAALMAPLVTKVSAYAMVRVLMGVYGLEMLRDEQLILDLIAWAGAFAVIVGAVLALVQSDLWRLLAYSSISQMGIVALGVGVANQASLTGGVMHIANDALMKAALFLAATFIVMRFGVRRVDELCKLRGRAPWVSASVVVTGLSLVGLPPMCGFFGKWYVLKGAVQDERWALAGAIVIGSLATAAYVARLIEALYFSRQPEDQAPAPARGAGLALVACVVLAAAVIGLGLASNEFIQAVIEPALPSGL